MSFEMINFILGITNINIYIKFIKYLTTPINPATRTESQKSEI